jgi:hypothetical protein
MKRVNVSGTSFYQKGTQGVWFCVALTGNIQVRSTPS